MKNLTILLALTFLFFQKNKTQAQVYIEGNSGYFFTALVNENNYGFPEMDFELTSTPNLGFNFGYAIFNKHHFQIGVRYLNLGQNYTSTFNEISHKRQVDLDYLMIPASYKIVFGSMGNYQQAFRGLFSVGGYFGSLRKAKTTYAISDTEVPFLQFHQSQNLNPKVNSLQNWVDENGSLLDEKALFENIDLGVQASIGMRFQSASGVALNIEFIGGYGLQNVNSQQVMDVADKATNNLWGGVQIGLAYYFAFDYQAY